MKKRLLSLLLVVAMGVTMLTGCGESDSNGQSAKNDAQQEAAGGEAADAEQGEPEKIIMTYIVLSDTPEDLPKVQEAVNEISIPAINVEVELKPIQIAETFSNYSLWVGSGEQIDLMCVCFSGLSMYINSGLIEPLDELIAENAPAITALLEEYPISEGAVANDEIYGISPVSSYYGFQGGMLLKQEYLDEIEYEEKDVYTLAELTDIFTQMKELHPDMYFGPIWGNSGTGASNANFFGLTYDTMGATTTSGVLMDVQDSKITNLYEEEEYYEFLKVMRQWYEAGLTMTDAATTDVTGTELLLGNVMPGYAMSTAPGQAESATAQFGGEFVSLPLCEGYRPSISPSANVYWTVPISSANPQAAMKFLNLMYENHEILNLLTYGIADYNYTMTETEGVIEQNPEHLFNTGFAMYGDERYKYSTNPELTKEKYDAFTEMCVANTSIAAGYGYDASAMQNQIIAIQAVLDEYLPALETGSAADLEGTYQEFIKKLKDAGIDDVIADNQAQLDAWLAEQ